MNECGNVSFISFVLEATLVGCVVKPKCHICTMFLVIVTGDSEMKNRCVCSNNQDV